jgi:hypothetical protein
LGIARGPVAETPACGFEGAVTDLIDRNPVLIFVGVKRVDFASGAIDLATDRFATPHNFVVIIDWRFQGR